MEGKSLCMENEQKILKKADEYYVSAKEQTVYNCQMESMQYFHKTSMLRFRN